MSRKMVPCPFKIWSPVGTISEASISHNSRGPSASEGHFLLGNEENENISESQGARFLHAFSVSNYNVVHQELLTF